MNFEQMQNRVYAVVRDEPKVFVLQSEVQDWLNEANVELARRLRVLRATAAGATAGSTIALPADFLEALTLDLAGKKVEFVQDPTMDARQGIGGTPGYTSARVFGNALEMFPTPPNGTAYTLRYVKAPATMSIATDVSDLPVSLHVKVVNYARAHAMYKMGEIANADRYMGLYEQGLPAAESVVVPRNPLQAAPGPRVAPVS
jgi:hypothetical protein